jgi:hypothetical protein
METGRPRNLSRTEKLKMSATKNPIEPVIRDMIAADQDMGNLKLEIGRVEMFCLIGAIQLACRHPQYTGPSRQLVEQVVRRISLAFPSSARNAIEKGWDTQYDTVAVSA